MTATGPSPTSRSDLRARPRLGCRWARNFGDIDNDGYLDFYLGTGRADYSTSSPSPVAQRGGPSVRGRDDLFGHRPPCRRGTASLSPTSTATATSTCSSNAGGATPGDKAHNALFNNPGHHRHWLTLRLVGTRSNRFGLGAPRPAGRRGSGRPAFHLPRHHGRCQLRQQPAVADDRAGSGRSARRSRDRLAGRGRSPAHPRRAARRRGRGHRGRDGFRRLWSSPSASR